MEREFKPCLSKEATWRRYTRKAAGSMAKDCPLSVNKRPYLTLALDQNYLHAQCSHFMSQDAYFLHSF